MKNDSDWHLDVKKSTARPPALIRGRLTDLAAKLRAQARGVFAHRGEYGPRSPAPQELERPWKPATRDGKRYYSINREHPAVRAVLQQFQKNATEIEALLRILEETVPVEQIWLDTAEQLSDRSVPYETVDTAVLRADMRRTFDLLVKTGLTKEAACQRLLTIEPFNRYPKMIQEI